MRESKSTTSSSSRRRFVGTSAASAAAIGSMVHSSTARAEEKQELRLALVGCGGRGRGAVTDSFKANEGVKLTAIADIDAKQIEYGIRLFKRGGFEDRLDVPESAQHVGLDAYKKILDDKSIDLVLLTTPPGFRPYHIQEAVQAGKHVFAEKPSCVDPTGYRMCLESHRQAEENGTAIVTGTQYRRQVNYVAAVEQIRNGAIGEIVSAKSKYCSTGIWFKNRLENQTDTEYQLYNWMHYIWLSGDQIAEQAVHNIDAMNWVMGGPPESAYGSGGRFTRQEGSEMWDSMTVEYTYPGNRLLSFMCRQIPGSKSENGSVIYGTKGVMEIDAFSDGSRIKDWDGNVVWSQDGSINLAYQQEHKDLVDSIRAGKPIVELVQTAQSSLTAVMGRLAAYTGQRVSWDFVANESKLNLFPSDIDPSAERPDPQFAIPGKTKLV